MKNTLELRDQEGKEMTVVGWQVRKIMMVVLDELGLQHGGQG